MHHSFIVVYRYDIITAEFVVVMLAYVIHVTVVQRRIDQDIFSTSAISDALYCHI